MPAPNDYQLLSNYLILGAILFSLGTIGFLIKRNLVVMFLSIGSMIQGSLLTLVGFTVFHASLSGQVFVFTVLMFSILYAVLAMVIVTRFLQINQSLDPSAESNSAISDSIVPSENDDPASRGQAE